MKQEPKESSKKDPVARLIFELAKLPGIGEKTATRLAHYILRQDQEYASSLSQALLNAKQQTTHCETCLTLTSQTPCEICSNPKRDPSRICVVEKPSDIFPIEQTSTYQGLYHVLHGLLSPLDGIGPDEIKVAQLMKRIENQNHSINEVILALNPSVEGEATMLYIMRLLRPLNIPVTKLAYGLPAGGQLEYADRQTISQAIENRAELR